MTALRFGSAAKPAEALTDDELRSEIAARRKARGASPLLTAGALGGLPDPSERRRVQQWYANLDLRDGASLADVEARYQKLVAEFHPSKHATDPAKHRAATELIASLTKAHEGLVAYLKHAQK